MKLFVEEVGSDDVRDWAIAGSLAVEHALRGFDAIHLAAALALTQPQAGVHVAFCSFDTHSNRAAAAAGLEVRGPMKA